jgi:hypothetical protein
MRTSAPAGRRLRSSLDRIEERKKKEYRTIEKDREKERKRGIGVGIEQRKGAEHW